MTAPALGSLIAYRLRIRNPSTLGNPDGTTDALLFSTLAGVGTPYILDAPTGDGAEIDVIAGAPTLASYRVLVIDGNGGTTPPGLINPGGVVTNNLGDITGRNQLLSRRAYVEVSTDNGTTWQAWATGYVNRIRLVDAATYEFSIGETRRLEQATQVFQTITPGLDGGTCVLGGPIGGTPQPAQVLPHAVYTVTALPWNSATGYVLGNTVQAGGIIYICINPNTNQPPPQAAFWQPVPAPFVPSGVYGSANTYAVGSVLVGLDGQAYIAIQPVPINTPPPNVTYWEPLQAVLLPSWGMVQDFGGVTCVVSTVGGSTQSLKMTLQAGWFKIPIKSPGEPAWRYAVGNAIPADFSSANALVPALAAQYGQSPVGYGGTFLNPWGGVLGNNLPRGVKTTNSGGTVDSVLGSLGWTIGGIALQVQLPNGQVVTVGAYPQLYNSSIDKGTRYTVTPVLIYPKARTILVDWHDFYRLDPNTLLPVAPYDQNGNQVALPPAGTTLLVKAVVVPISDQAPLHIAAHPIDILTTLWNNAGISYNASNLAACRAAMGSDLVLVLRPTEAMSLGDFLEQYIAGPLGYALRISAVSSTDQHGNTGTGYYELVDVRTPPQALPSVTWTDNDCYGEDTENDPLFDLDEQTICQSVQAQWETFAAWDPTLNQNRPLDDVVPIQNQATFIDADFASFGSQTASYDIPGGFAHALMQGGGLMSAFMQGKANHIFERFGRGATLTVLPILNTSPQVNIGDQVLVASARLPNPAINQRGGARLCLVTKKTPGPLGPLYEVQDLGAQSQPAQIAPTFTLAQDPADTAHVVDVTVTNLATLQVTYPTGALLVEYATGTSTPSGNGILGLDIALSSLGGPFVLPPLPIGSKVWVRMQVRPGAGQLPSIFTSWANVTLATPNAITNLTWTDQGNGAGKLAWTNTDGTTPIQIWLTPASAVGFSPTVTTVFTNVSTLSLQTGQTQTLTAQAFDQKGNPMAGTASWSSSNNSIATVGSGTGLVTAVAVGSCNIIATIGGGQGICQLTVTAAVGQFVGSVTVSPNPFSGATSTTVTFSAVVKDTLGNVMAGRTITWATTAGSFVSNVLTLPSSPTPTITVTATDSGSGVQGTATGQAVSVFSNLAQLARASGGKTMLAVFNQNYPNDNFSFINHARISAAQQAALGLPNISAGYGSATPGIADGNLWPQMVDINGVLSFNGSAVAAGTNNATIAAVSTGTFWWKTRVKVDGLYNLPLNSGAGLFRIASDATGSNPKMEAYVQSGGTAKAYQLVMGIFKTGGSRIAGLGSGFATLTIPNGCWINFVGFVNPTGNTWSLWMYDDNGTQIKTNSGTNSVALNTDGGANGIIYVNQAFNASGPTTAQTYGGLAFYTSSLFAAPQRWQPAQSGDSGITALYPMGDATSGTVSTIQHLFTGTNLTVSAGTVTGAYDNGGPYNWLLYPNGPGGEIVDENSWGEQYVINQWSSPTSATFFSPYDPTVIKCRSLGIKSRAYLIEGTGTNAKYGGTINSLTAAKNGLQTYVNGVVVRCVQTYGTAAQGGIATWNINEFINGGGVVGSNWNTAFPISLSGTKSTGWAGYLASLILAADPTCKVMFNFNNIHIAAESKQQAASVTFLTQFFVDYPSINPSSIIAGNEFHNSSTSIPTASDAAAWHSYAAQVAAIGCWIHPSEMDVTDQTFPGTGTTQRVARQQNVYKAWPAYFTTGASGCFGEPTVWAKMYGLSTWGSGNPVQSWENIGPPAGANRTDDLEWSNLLDIDWSRLGGAGSNRDVYGIYSSFLQTKAAGG